MKFASVYVFDVLYSLDKIYEYYVPEELEDSVDVGSYVCVPFGNGNRKRQAVVFSVSSDCEYENPKPIHSVISENDRVSEEFLRLAEYMKDNTFCTISDALKTILPTSQMTSEKEYYYVFPDKEKDFENSKYTGKFDLIYSYIKTRGNVSVENLKKHFGADVVSSLGTLVNLGYLKKDRNFEKKKNIKTIDLYYTELSEEEIDSILSGKGNIKVKSAKQADVLRLLRDGEKYSAEEIKSRVGVGPSPVKALLENKISERHARSLLKLSNSTQQNEMLNRIISERLTVRRTDEEIEKIKNSSSDESNDDSQKIIEKGEIDMNNNMFGMPTVPQNPQSTTPSFDIFGTGNQQPVPTQPVVNPIPEVAQPTPNFNIFETDSDNDENNGGMASVNIPVMESVPSVPAVASVPEVQPIQEVQSMQQPVVPSAPIVPEAAPAMPTMESVPSAPEVPKIEPVVPNTPAAPEVAPIFTLPTMESAPSIPEIQPIQEAQPMEQPVVPSAPIVPEVAPAMPTMESVPSSPEVPKIEPVVPQTAPIMESPMVENVEMTQQSENLFSFGDNNISTLEPQPTEVAAVPEFKMPEPIIITDYSKQYDPVMPQTAPLAPTVDFKEVISAIRECSSKIEKYGFKIDVEEYDLANLYQVIFKIEK